MLKKIEIGDPKATRLLDVGTGSGVLAISFALEQPKLEVVAVDISDDALGLARENAEKHGVPDRISFCQSDLLDRIDGPFHWIVANLPYIPSADLPGLQREVQFDPALALDGGQDGLTIIKRLIESIPGKIASNGLVALELGQGQAERVWNFLARQNYRDITIMKDYHGVERILIARYG